MNFLRLLPVIVSFVLLTAHFYRAELPVLAAVCAFFPLVLFLQKPWVPQLFQGVLIVGALEWLRTLYMLAAMRIGFDQPWGRLALIIGAVALLTALSGLVFNSRSLRVRYRRLRIGGSGQPERP
ncbi:MAG TPA: hypothetical protein VJ902_01465 [Wenzhouxiangellaceae bacterium]|nr:hypothetical protein [Wenzhouxiangellaceae bacterium]